jgi:hypothetical protein
MAPFGDITVWNSVACCVVVLSISPYPYVTTLMLGGPLRSVAPETISRSGGERFQPDTSYDRPGPLVP